MASIKIKFRPSSVNGKEGTLYYRIIHKRKVREHSTGFSLFPQEWDADISVININSYNIERAKYLYSVKDKVDADIERLKHIVSNLTNSGNEFSADDILDEFNGCGNTLLFSVYMQSIILDYKRMGKIRTAEAYSSTLRSFMRFSNGSSPALNMINSKLMIKYEAYLKSCNVCSNSISFYMRNLRAVYNSAVENNLVEQQHPFKHVYTGIEKTVKRALTAHNMRLIKQADLGGFPLLNYARDMFMFSFYTRGMSFIDMAFLKKDNLNGNIITYRRRKTNQLMHIKYENCMKAIVEKYKNKNSEYLLPIIGSTGGIDTRIQYIYAAHNINRSLKALGKRLGLPIPLTMYVARHSWASIAKSRNIPVSIISDGMGHESEKTTRIYLASLDNFAVDKANNLIIKSI